MIIEVSDLQAIKNNKNRLLSLDVGEKTIGLALSDRLWIIGTPQETLIRKSIKADVETLFHLIEKHHVGALIMGYPLHMNGTEGISCKRIMHLVEQFKNSIPIVLWDERLSTAAVERTLLEADTSRKKRKKVIDKLASSYILQGVLDRMNYS